MKKKKASTDPSIAHFERLWASLPEGSPLRSLGKEQLREIALPENRLLLASIDPTRKHPYSLIICDLLEEEQIEQWLLLIGSHQSWLARHDLESLQAFQNQYLACARSLAQPNKRLESLAAATESLEALGEKATTRENLREHVRNTNPELLPSDTPHENRDHLKRLDRIYQILKSPPGRPKTK